ncbi:outer membrane lipoprotein LolB [Ramlibacter sp.]|uniref:outer membrane lipoprotein LolB n=1 Tax=Ramlibacter sp. TaxID=1917967 RepID=UPI003D112BFD
MTGWLARAALALTVAAAAGCAAPPRAPSTDEAATSWSGRLSLQVEDRRLASFSAGFDLQGSAQQGELTLTGPLGGTVAVLNWRPGAATMKSGERTSREFPSLEALAAEATGTPLPIAALFDWLRGVDTRVPGWEADLSEVAQGRLRARRVDPPPAADLRIAFER